MSVGMSKAVERPVCPLSSRKRKRAFVSSAVPKPANWRIVQSRPRYMLGYTPRVYGNSPGRPTRASTPPGRSSAVYTGSPSRPERGGTPAGRPGAVRGGGRRQEAGRVGSPGRPAPRQERADAGRTRAPPPVDELPRHRQPVGGHQHAYAHAERGRGVEGRADALEHARHAAVLEEALHDVRLGGR